MLRRASLPVCVVPVASSLELQTRNSFAVRVGKADINMGRFSYNAQYDESRLRSGRENDMNTEKLRQAYWRVDEFLRRAEASIQNQGFFYLPTLEFPWFKGCMPLFSSYQIRVHYSRHHRAYVDKLNKLIEGTPLYGYDLDEIIRRTHGDDSQKAVFNNAAQHYNHCFFWKSIQPYGSNMPPDLQAAVEAQYGSVAEFKKRFTDAGLSLFGSGWVYWVYDLSAQKFDILSYSNAGCPLTNNQLVPLLCVDVWEHTYYIDYENDRAAFLGKFFDVADFHWAEQHWKRATGQPYQPMEHS